MPSAQDYLSSLSKDQTITILSNDSMKTRVNNLSGAKTYTGTPKTATVVPQFDPFVSSTLSPIELLHSVGRATTPITTNLADLSSTWAMTRYVWAFEPVTTSYVNPLKMSGVAQDIDRHQKSVLSDEMGVGMARWVMYNYFDATDQINTEEALANPRLRHQFGGARQDGSTSPDHIYQLTDGSFAVVECKGTQKGPSYSRKQLRRGLEQVPSISLPNATSTAYVISTRLTKSKVEVRVIDPPPEESEGGEKPGKEQRKEINIESEEDFRDFRQGVERVNGAKLLAFAGSSRSANRIVTEEEPDDFLRENPPTQEEIGELDTAFAGQEIELRSSDARMFVGVADDVMNALRDPQYYEQPGRVQRFDLLPRRFQDRFTDAVDERKNRLSQRVSETRAFREGLDDIERFIPNTPSTAVIELDEGSIAAIDEDGSILLVRR